MHQTPTESLPQTDIYVVNPFATNGDGFEVPEGAIVLSTEADREENIKNLRALLVDGSYRVRVNAGDGTVAWAVEASVLSEQDVEISIKKGGYKNDMAAMVAKAGGRIAISPLALEKQQDDQDEPWGMERMVAYSFGLGAIAVGAKIANSQKFRDEKRQLIDELAEQKPGWLIRSEFLGSAIADLGLVRKLLASEVEVDGQKYPTSAIVNGRRVGAMIVSNGQIMSGGGMRFWQKLHEPGFVTSWVGESWPAKVFGMGLRMVGANPKNDVWMFETGRPFEINEDTLAQADGEDFALKKGVYRMRELGKTSVTLSVET